MLWTYYNHHNECSTDEASQQRVHRNSEANASESLGTFDVSLKWHVYANAEHIGSINPLDTGGCDTVTCSYHTYFYK